MLELSFIEPETFLTPDGSEYIINPLPTREMKRVNEFIELNTLLQQYQSEGNDKEANKLIYGSEDDPDKRTIASLCEELIDLSIKNIEDGSDLPKKYRTIFKMIELCTFIVKATLQLPDNITPPTEGDTPLGQAGKSSDKSEETPIASSKKPAGQKQKS